LAALIQPIGMVLAAALATARPPKCPGDEGLRRELGIEGASWQMTCTATRDGRLEMAALLSPLPPSSSPRLVVAVRRGEVASRAEVALGDLAQDGIPSLAGDDWRLSVRPAGIAGADWLRVDVTAMTGEEKMLAQTVTAFFRDDGPLVPLWTGAGERHERRFDSCTLDTSARFSLSPDGELVRVRRTKRSFGEPGEPQPQTDGDAAAPADGAGRTACVAPPPTRDAFPVADDGLAADVTVDDALRARARANRLLYVRAPGSDEAFAAFVADAVSLLEPLERAVETGKPVAPNQDVVSVRTAGAFAYLVEGAMRASLDWKHLRAAARPAGRRLVAALEAFDRDHLGAWIEPRTDLGGCHSPARAEKPLAKLVDAWLAAPAAVREAFDGYLAGRIEDMATDGCLCPPRDARESTRTALDRNAALLERLPGLGAAPAGRLRALATAPGTTFGCPGPH
jgi:hypothetical protein